MKKIIRPVTWGVTLSLFLILGFVFLVLRSLIEQFQKSKTEELAYHQQLIQGYLAAIHNLLIASAAANVNGNVTGIGDTYDHDYANEIPEDEDDDDDDDDDEDESGSGEYDAT